MRFYCVFLIAAMPAFSQPRPYPPPPPPPPPYGQPRSFGGSAWEPTGFVGVGMSTPVNPTASQLNNVGFNITGGFGFTQGYVGATIDALFNTFGVNDGTLQKLGARGGSERFWAITVNPNVHINPAGPADFYIVAGAGLYGQFTGIHAAAAPNSYYDLTRTDTIHRLGVNGGAGFSFAPSPYSRIKVFIEARYHHLVTLDRGSSFIPVTVGVRF